MLAKKMRMAAAGNANDVHVDEVFATNTYMGISAIRDVPNFVDLQNNGGMVWVKLRDTTGNHLLANTERGTAWYTELGINRVEQYDSSSFTAFNTNGFSVGSSNIVNTSSKNYVSYTFRRASKFFDVITWSGDHATDRILPHNIGGEVGMVAVRSITGDTSPDTYVWHRNLDGVYPYLELSSAVEQQEPRNGPDPISVDENNLTVHGNGGSSGYHDLNNSGEEYVAYLWAHDPEGKIQCGTYEGNGTDPGPTITLGWEPQFLLVKCLDAASDWVIMDNKRDMANPNTKTLKANTGSPEYDEANDEVDFLPTGFQIKNVDSDWNQSGKTYVYMAIKYEAPRPKSDTGYNFAAYENGARIYSDDGDEVVSGYHYGGYSYDSGLTDYWGPSQILNNMGQPNATTLASRAMQDTTLWSSGYWHYTLIDLGSECTFNTAYYFQGGYGRTTEVSLSTDPAARFPSLDEYYTSIHGPTAMSSATSGSLTQVSFPETTARFVRIGVKNDGSMGGQSYAELFNFKLFKE